MANPRNLANIAPLFSKSTSTTIDYSGTNLKFSGTAQRLLIKTDGTQSDRFAFQSNATDGNTRLWIYPSGTGNITGVAGHTSASDFTNYNAFDLAILGGASQEVRLSSNAAGTATAYPITFRIGASEQMRLTSTGLGIGTSSPASKLEVYNSAVNGAFVANTTSTWRVAQIRNDQTSTSGSAAGIAFVGRTDTQPAGIVAINGNTTGGIVSLGFLTVDGNQTFERMRLDSSGNVGIGTSSPVNKLSINSTTSLMTSQVQISHTAGDWGLVIKRTTDESGNPNLAFVKSRSETGTQIVQGDSLGRLSWHAVTNTTGPVITPVAEIGAVNINFTANDADSELFFATKSIGGSLTEKVRIKGNGNLGIGLTNPGAKLEIYGSGNLVRLGDGTNTHDLRFQGPNNWDLQLNTTTDIFSVRRNSVSFLSVDSDAKTLARRLSLTDGNGFSRYALSYSNWGYSNGYKVLVVGSTSTSYNVNTTGAVTVSFNYDPINNTNSAFSGDGREILFRRGTRFVTPNAADTSFNLYNLVMIDGNVGIGTDSPATNLDVRGSTSATIRVGSTGNGGSGDEFGNLEFYWADPDAAEVKAKIYAKNVGNVGPGGGGAADLLFATRPASGTLDERVRITSGGNVGIGTQSPGRRLTISRATEAASEQLEIRNVGGITNGNYDGIVWTQDANGSTALASIRVNYANSGAPNMSFNLRSDSNVLFLEAGGNVGIGTNDPGYKLEVNGTIKSGIAGNSSANYAALGVAASGTNDGQAVIAIQQETSEGDTIIFADVEPYVEYGISHENTADSIHFTGGVSTPSLGTKTFYNRSGTARTAYIKTSINLGNGNVGIAGNLSVSGTITESSSITIKENINPIMNALESIISMNGYVYDRKDGTAKQRAGLIAEEVNNVLPNVVAKDDDGNPTGIQYTNLIAYLVESIKTLHKRIESLEK